MSFHAYLLFFINILFLALSSTYSQPRIMKKLEESNLQLHLEKLKVDPSVDVSKGNTSVSRKYFRHTSSTIVN